MLTDVTGQAPDRVLAGPLRRAWVPGCRVGALLPVTGASLAPSGTGRPLFLASPKGRSPPVGMELPWVWGRNQSGCAWVRPLVSPLCVTEGGAETPKDMCAGVGDRTRISGRIWPKPHVVREEYPNTTYLFFVRLYWRSVCAPLLFLFP